MVGKIPVEPLHPGKKVFQHLQKNVNDFHPQQEESIKLKFEPKTTCCFFWCNKSTVFFWDTKPFLGIPKTTTSWRFDEFAGHGGGIAKERFRRGVQGSLVTNRPFWAPNFGSECRKGNGTPGYFREI